ncbi:hypothetical protein CR513_09155, partial [Mucuna pruriens]
MYGSDENQDSTIDIFEIPSFSRRMPTFNAKNEINDIHVIGHDHIEELSLNHNGDRNLSTNFDQANGNVVVENKTKFKFYDILDLKQC